MLLRVSQRRREAERVGCAFGAVLSYAASKVRTPPIVIREMVAAGDNPEVTTMLLVLVLAMCSAGAAASTTTITRGTITPVIIFRNHKALRALCAA